MGLSRLAKKCQACPYVSTCDHKRMEALGYLPLPEANVEVKVDLSATPTAELVDQLSRAVQIPKTRITWRSSTTLEQTLETVAKIQKAWDALALSISDAAEAFAKMWEEVFSSPDIWPGRKSVPPKKYGMSLLKKRPYQAFPAYHYHPIAPRNRPYQRRSY